MRTLLAVASVTLLIAGGFGCGDDTTTTTSGDMAVTLDLATGTPHDMQQLTCAQVLSCEQSCAGNATCAGACATEANSNAKVLLGKLLVCLYDACNPDAGNANGSCTGAPGTDTSAGCLSCINATGQHAALGDPCHTEFTNCASM